MIRIPLPQRLKVGGHTYSIETSAKINAELNSRNAWGLHNATFRRIQLDTSSSEAQFSQAALHEFLHAVDTVYSDGNLSDLTVSTLSEGLLQILEQLGVRLVKR